MTELHEHPPVVGNLALVWDDDTPTLMTIVSVDGASTVLEHDGARRTYPTSEVQDTSQTPKIDAALEPATHVPPHVNRPTPDGVEIAPKVDSAEYLESGRGTQYGDPAMNGDIFGGGKS